MKARVSDPHQNREFRRAWDGRRVDVRLRGERAENARDRRRERRQHLERHQDRDDE